MEWPSEDGWNQDVIDPHERIGSFAILIQSIHARWEKSGNIGAGSYWSEPPRALAAVEYYAGCFNACRARARERMS